MALGKLRRLISQPEEFGFRLCQELKNPLLLLLPPKLPVSWQPASLPLPPGPQVARQLLADPATAPYRAEIARLAAEIRAHRFPALGLTLETGPEIHWRRDTLTGIESGLQYFRRIPYLDAARAGDHKIVWELNRHQHLVLLAQDWLLHANTNSLAELSAQLESWLTQNPFQRGMNWTSALEVAFRALSWLWVLHLAGHALPTDLRHRTELALFRHGHHLEINLSVYFSPNTHLLGEALALLALGIYFHNSAIGPHWRQLGDRTLQRELFRQTSPDGSYFEQSTYYHVYALDIFLFHALLSPPGPETVERLTRMTDFLAHLLGPARHLPFFGDDDGGRFFHPFGDHAAYGRATLATAGIAAPDPPMAEQCAWWGGPLLPRRSLLLQSRLFPDTGMVAFIKNGFHVLFDTGPFGTGTGGHSHADTLSFTLSGPHGEILIDPATYRYVGDAAGRNAFRSASAHNTLSVDGFPQAEPAGPFSWRTRPQVRLERCLLGNSVEEAQAACRFAGLLHRRRLIFHHSGFLLVFDELTAAPGIPPPPGPLTVEQGWLLPNDNAAACLWAPGSERTDAWRSPALGLLLPAVRYRLRHRGQLPFRAAAAFRLDPALPWTDLPGGLEAVQGTPLAVSPGEDGIPWRS